MSCVPLLLTEGDEVVETKFNWVTSCVTIVVMIVANTVRWIEVTTVIDVATLAHRVAAEVEEDVTTLAFQDATPRRDRLVRLRAGG